MKLILFLKANWIFNKPKKKNILIYDEESEKIAHLIFNKEDCELMSVRYESLNLYIIILTLLKSGIKNFQNNYKLNYIKTVSPKIIFSVFTWNPAFFKLKDIYNEATYINIISSNIDNRFKNECDKYYSDNQNKRLKADHIFIPGKYYENIFSKLIDANIYISGSFLNNYFNFTKKNDANNIRSLLFISQINPFLKDYPDNCPKAKYMEKIKKEIKIFSVLNDYCKRKKYKLNLCSKNPPSSETYYRNNYAKGNWNFFPNTGLGSYKIANNSNLIVFTNSTLGIEVLSKRIRAVSFPPENFPIEDHSKKYPSAGPFWSCAINQQIIESYLEKIIKYSDEEWDQVIKENIDDIMKYDPKNTVFYEVMKKNNLQHLIL